MPNSNEAPPVEVAVAEPTTSTDLDLNLELNQVTAENRLDLPDGNMLIPRPDYGTLNLEGEDEPVAKYALDIVSIPCRVFEINETTGRYGLLEGKTIDAQTGNIVDASPNLNAPQPPSGGSTVDLSDDDDNSGQGGIRGVTKTGGSNVDLTNDEFYTNHQMQDPKPDQGGPVDWTETKRVLMSEIPSDVLKDLLSVSEEDEKAVRKFTEQFVAH